MPIRNEGPYIERCLASILAQDYPPQLIEILIADGMSSDGTRDVVLAARQKDSRIRLIDNPRQIVSTGLNAVLPQARGEVIVRVDGHCEIDPMYVRRCVEYLREPGVAAVGGPLATVGETVVAQAIAAAMSSRFGVGDSMFRVGSDQPRLVDTVAFPGYAKWAIEAAGPFDEELVRNQDDEYSFRLRSMGFRILLAPDVRSRYYSRGTVSRLWRQYYQYGYWKVRVMQKHPRQMRPRHFAPPLFVAALAVSALSAAVISRGWMLGAALLLPYLAVILAGSIQVAGSRGWKLLPFLPFTFLALHLGYGSGFLVGLVKFAHRWQDRGAPAIIGRPANSEAMR
jgi:glycosyltransferase involved in cell wall biosynthesis